MKIERRLVVFRFNMVEVALALIILAIGLSSVMVLFPVGLRASRSSVAENNLADVAERVAAYMQARYTSGAVWTEAGAFSGDSIEAFEAEPSDSSVPTAGDFDTSDSGSSNSGGMDGLFASNAHPGCWLYQQYTSVRGGNERAIDFEAIVRVGWDNSTASYGEIYYPMLAASATDSEDAQSQRKLSRGYTRTNGGEPTGTRMNEGISTVLNYIYRTLIIEISWPADAPWSSREKRIYRVEMFNENFIPYPKTSGGGSGGGGGSGSGG